MSPHVAIKWIDDNGHVKDLPAEYIDIIFDQPAEDAIRFLNDSNIVMFAEFKGKRLTCGRHARPNDFTFEMLLSKVKGMTFRQIFE